jgi:ABC-type glutathione transport system ATPase component
VQGNSTRHGTTPRRKRGPMPLLEIEDLRYTLRLDSIGTFRKGRRLLLKGVSLGVEKGASVALLGDSGSGKTTLARCIAGLVKPDSGTITFSGVNLFPQTANRETAGAGIQMLFQASGASLDPCMTVLDSLAEGITQRAGRSSGIDAEARALISSVGLSRDCLGRLPSQLSGGQRQRIALARALSAGPRLLVLDEPTSALDTLTSAHLVRLLRSLQASEGFSLLLITHDVKTALSSCDRVAVLHDGVVVEEGSCEDVRLHPRHDYTRQLLRDSRIDP